MVVTLMRLCLCFCLYHKVQLLVNAKMNSLPFFGKSTPRFKTKMNSLPFFGKSKPKLTTITSFTREEMDKNLLETPGCTIPNIWTDYRIVETKDCHNHCGTRAVFIEKFDYYIEFTIDEKQMKEYFGEEPYQCCSKFAYKSFTAFDGLQFNECIPFLNGSQIILEHEIVTVTCQLLRNSTVQYVYEDAYIIIKKNIREATINNGNSWNVLLLGMDTMSRGRAIQSMPELVKYFKKNDWLDYRAFQKADSNTYPNLMITYTGILTHSLLYDVCKTDMETCNGLFIWSKFKSSGFVTAYGQDSLYHTFDHTIPSQPTDHVTRPFFLLGTHTRGNIVCLRSKPCSYHILDYIYQFAEAYKDAKYFGSFFTSNYSHDPVNIPALLQNQYIDLFKKLNALGALNNTIIFFYGDHGVRYGPLKIPAASYYDERLPMLYIWFPHSFRERFKDKYYNLQLNQNRLTTHSDMHSTLWDILKLSDDRVTIIPPKYCPSCGSLFEEKSIHRRCEDMGVTARWCSCYVLHQVISTDIAATLVPEILLYRINTDNNKEYQIGKILRHQWFRDEKDLIDNTTYYVIAIQVTHADKRFEGVIKQHQFNFDVLGEIDDISPREQAFDTSQC